MCESEPWPIPPQTGGAYVDPATVVGRDSQISHWLEQLKSGSNLLLADPRRFGKTATLRRLCDQPDGALIAVFVNVEGLTSSEAIFERIVSSLSQHASLWDRAKDWLRHVVEVSAAHIVTVKAAFDRRSPMERLRLVAEAIDKNLGDESLVIVLDEVPLAVANIATSESAADAHAFLQVLRSLRSGLPKIRWILSGSIGFHHVLRLAKATEGALNELQVLPLGPLDGPGATLLARCLAMGIERELSAEARESVVYLTGGVPFLMHHLMHRLGTDGEGLIEKPEAQEQWDRFIADRDASRSMTHLVTRIEDYPSQWIEPARELLDATAKNPAKATEVLERMNQNDRLTLLNYLIDDHYLQYTDDKCVQWKYDVLRRIWVVRRQL